MPDLIVALRDSEWQVRRQAAIARGEIGPPAEAAKRDLEELRMDPDQLVRKAAQQAIKQMP